MQYSLSINVWIQLPLRDQLLLILEIHCADPDGRDPDPGGDNPNSDTPMKTPDTA